jgi:F0F1-type ATP synthase assembly protein I
VDRHRASRSALALGFEWASRVTTIGLEFALPTLLGLGLDYELGSAPLATIVGSVLGFVTGMMHTVRMARQISDESSRRAMRPGSSDGPARSQNHDRI